jgi:hypothetical protein
MVGLLSLKVHDSEPGSPGLYGAAHTNNGALAAAI